MEAIEFKGTKGEWEIKPNQEYYSNGFVRIDIGLYDCVYYGEQKEKGDPFSEETLSDAKLIAAAPDLLHALQVYLNAGSKEQLKEASEIAKKAINKALL